MEGVGGAVEESRHRGDYDTGDCEARNRTGDEISGGPSGVMPERIRSIVGDGGGDSECYVGVGGNVVEVLV